MLKTILIVFPLLLSVIAIAQEKVNSSTEPTQEAKAKSSAPSPAKPVTTPKTPKKSACPPLPRKNYASAAEVYAKMPFKAGETATYKMSYKGLYVGDAVLSVQPPHQFQGSWQQVFDGYGRTGAWYKWIFVAEDQIRAIAHPDDFGVSWFYMEQDEGKLLKKRFIRKKFLDFNTSQCIVNEKTIKDNGKPSEKKHAFEPGAMDVLSASFKLRALDLKVGQKLKFPMFTSGKNWTAEVEVLADETLKVPDMGTYKTIKLKLKTYIGEHLEQKGDSYIWIAYDHPQKPIVQIEAVIKIGSVYGMLKNFMPGSS